MARIGQRARHQEGNQMEIIHVHSGGGADAAGCLCGIGLPHGFNAVFLPFIAVL